MAFCATCGAPVEGRFCAKCGTPVAAAPPPPAAAPGAGAPPPPPPPAQPAGGYAPPPAAAPMAENVASALCYILGLITGIIFLVMAPYNQNRNIRFHAFQSIFFNIACIVIWIVVGMVIGIMQAALHMWFFGFGIHSLINLCLFIGWIYLLIATYQGKKVVLPIIGPLAQQQAGN